MNHLRSKIIVDHDERFQFTLKSWKKQEYLNIHQNAHQFNMNSITLHQWINKNLSIVKSCEQQQLLSIAKEIAFYLYNIYLSRQEYYSKLIIIKKITKEFQKTHIKRININKIQLIIYKSINEEWMKCFIDEYLSLKRACI